MWTLTPSRRRGPLDPDAARALTPTTGETARDVADAARAGRDAHVAVVDAVTAAPQATDPTDSSVAAMVRPPGAATVDARDGWRPWSVNRPSRAVVVAGGAGLLVGAIVAGGVTAAALTHADTPVPAASPAPAVRLDNGSGRIGAWQQMGTSRSSASVDAAAVLDPRGVLLIGDSQARRARAEIFAVLAAGKRPVAWDTGNGRPTHGTVDAYLAFLGTAGSPRTLLVLSGSNDVFEPQAFPTQIERLLSAAGPDRQVLWVTPYVNRVPTSAADLRNSQSLRSDLEAAAQRHPNLHLVRWGSHLQMLTDTQRARLLPDGVHPTPAAASQLAQLIGAALPA